MFTCLFIFLSIIDDTGNKTSSKLLKKVKSKKIKKNNTNKKNVHWNLNTNKIKCK